MKASKFLDVYLIESFNYRVDANYPHWKKWKKCLNYCLLAAGMIKNFRNGLFYYIFCVQRGRKYLILYVIWGNFCKSFLSLKKNFIYKHYMFMRHLENENIATYVTHLKLLETTCNYSCNNEMISDQCTKK